MRNTILSLLVLSVFCSTALSVSISQRAHMQVNDFLAALQPYINDNVDARTAWPWPEDSYEVPTDSTPIDSVALLLEESMVATGPTGSASGGGAAASGSTGATGDEDDETGSTGGTAMTGSTGGTGGTAMTGSTGATGDEEPEKPKEAKDATIIFDIGVTGVTKAIFLNEKSMQAFQRAIATTAKVGPSSVSISSAEKHDHTDPIAKAHAKAKALKDKKMNDLAADVKQSEELKGAQGAKSSTKKAISFLEVDGSEAVLDVKFTVSDIEPSRASATAQDLSSFITEEGDNGFATVMQKAGVAITGAKLNREPVVEGGKPKAGCAREVLKHLEELKTSNTPETDIPTRMRGFCRKSFNQRQHVLPASLSPTVIARTCERAFGIFNRRPVGKRQEAAVAESREYCYEMRQFFEYLIKKNGVTSMKHGVATSVSEINRQRAGQGITACCVPHQSGGCFDNKPNKNVMACVCNGGDHSHHPSKKDKFCCDTEWDLTCAENVEWYGCAACPQPEFLF